MAGEADLEDLAEAKVDELDLGSCLVIEEHEVLELQVPVAHSPTAYIPATITRTRTRTHVRCSGVGAREQGSCTCETHAPNHAHVPNLSMPMWLPNSVAGGDTDMERSVCNTLVVMSKRAMVAVCAV